MSTRWRHYSGPSNARLSEEDIEDILWLDVEHEEEVDLDHVEGSQVSQPVAEFGEGHGALSSDPFQNVADQLLEEHLAPELTRLQFMDSSCSVGKAVLDVLGVTKAHHAPRALAEDILLLLPKWLPDTAAHQAAACVMVARAAVGPQLGLHRVHVCGASADALYEPDQLHYKLKAAHVVPDHLLPEPAA
ncbi:hypothetical protein ABPG77_002284 [Micractinium sp. CCAP 211/92]